MELGVRLVLAVLGHGMIPDDLGYVLQERDAEVLEGLQQLLRENPELTFMQAEWMVLGADHGIVGAELLRRWGFPKEVYFAVRAHHDESLMLESRIAALTALSNALVNLMGIGTGVDVFAYHLPEGLREAAGVSEKDLYPALVETFEKAEALKASLLA